MQGYARELLYVPNIPYIFLFNAGCSSVSSDSEGREQKLSYCHNVTLILDYNSGFPQTLKEQC